MEEQITEHCQKCFRDSQTIPQSTNCKYMRKTIKLARSHLCWEINVITTYIYWHTSLWIFGIQMINTLLHTLIDYCFTGAVMVLLLMFDIHLCLFWETKRIPKIELVFPVPLTMSRMNSQSSCNFTHTS